MPCICGGAATAASVAQLWRSRPEPIRCGYAAAVRIGITGGAGFLGAYVAERAIITGHEVIIFDRQGNTPNSAWASRAQTFMGDVRNEVDMSELAKHVDGIIHLAAVLGTQETIKHPLPAHKTNTEGGLNFLAACEAEDIPGVYICVGNRGHKSTYPISKAVVEDYVDMYNIEHGTKINKVRVVNAYGPRQAVAPPFGPAKVRKITPAIVCRALLGQAVEIYGDGQQISDMVHVRDVARALVTSLEYAAIGKVIPKAVEVGPAEHLTVNEIADTIRAVIYNLYGTAQPDPIHIEMRPGEPDRAVVTAKTATLRLIGMSSEDLTPFQSGIEETIRWFHDIWLPTYTPPRERAVFTPLPRKSRPWLRS